MSPADAPHDRTLTAMRAPVVGAPARVHAVLLLAARSGSGGPAIPDGLRIVDGGVEIGRRPEAGAAGSAVALDDALASSRHARIVPRGDGWTIEDLGSKNGTFVNGVRVNSPANLPDGAQLSMGGHLMVFRLVTAPEREALEAEAERPLGPIATRSPRLAVLCGKLQRLATTQAELLLSGETGVGKEVYARAVHEVSARRGRFVAINCAALPRELVESELFGWHAGAHSAAHTAKPGLLEQAEGGTLFLDEIGEMPGEAQAKLLRFLQDREVTPLGATRARRLDVRVIAATHRAVRPGGQGGLREDLLGRLGASAFVVPPLRDRVEDLGGLTAWFLDAHRRAVGAGASGLDAAALRVLAAHPFPLNVRELEKIITAGAALADDGALIGLAHLPDALAVPNVAAPPSGPGAPMARKSPEPAPTAEELDALLQKHRGNVAEVSRSLGRQRAAVWRWIKRFGLGPDRYR